MTKNFKRVMSFVLALAMIFTMTAFSVNAETVTNNTGHSYDAYQIFSGTQATTGTALGDVKWGTGVVADENSNPATYNTVLNAVKLIKVGEATPFSGCTDAASVANVLANAGDNQEAYAKAFAKEIEKHLSSTKTEIASDAKSATLDAGYYLLKDTSVAAADETGYYTNLSLLQVTGDDIIIAKKNDVPKFEKKVDDKNDSTTTEDGENWQDSADYDIGDTIPYQLSAVLGTKIGEYETYSLVFHDELSKGLKLADNLSNYTVTAVKVYPATDTTNTANVVYGNAVTVSTSKYTVSAAANLTDSEKTDLTVTISDVLSLTDKEGNAITVNPYDKIVVEYSATLDKDAVIGSAGNPNTAYLEYSSNPNYEGSGEKGSTPEDTVIVFTYKFTVSKTDGDGNPLDGATFKLYKWQKANESSESKSWVQVGTDITPTKDSDNNYTASVNGIDDGYYKLVESVAPNGYNTAADLYFTVEASHQASADNPALESLTVTKLVEDENGSITFDDTTKKYKLAESDATFTVEYLSGGTNPTGTFSTTVENNQGSTLPETGGMGTKIFYTLGGILVVAAGILLITKRRMRNA